MIIKTITKNELSYGLVAPKLCCTPYHNHPKGCPNFNKRKDCPPFVQSIDQVLDLNKPMMIAGVKFDLGEHVNRMKEAHPEWTEYQTKCCLYWQGSVRKKLKTVVEELLRANDKFYAMYSPEAHGVNMTRTMKNIGIELEWPPERWVWKIALLGELL